MVYIYILQLEQGKYYIGKTNNPEFRLDQHYNSFGSQWTKLYKPIKLIELISNCDDYDEDKYTRIYMDKYGIHNVRGGSFVSVELDKKTIDILQQMNNGTNDKCFICGKKGHFVKDCEYNNYLQSFDTIEKIETEITDIFNLTHLIKFYNSPYKYISIHPNTKIEITPDLCPTITTNYPNIIHIINSIYSRCSGGSNYNLHIFNNNNTAQTIDNVDFIQSKINKIYIERRKQEIKYYESLPSEYAEIFKKNNYENIFEQVKDKLLMKIELLLNKQAQLYTK